MTFPRPCAALGGALLVLGLAACGGGGSGDNDTTIRVLSNRADLVSGGSALVEVKIGAGASPAQLRVTRDGVDVSAAFAVRADGRITGVVGGLQNGANQIVAKAADGTFPGAKLTITNHPIGGPVLLGSQATPWVCATPVPVAATPTTPGSNGSGLSTAAVDAQCNIATEYRLWYRTTTPVSAAAGDGGCAFVLPDPTPTLANPSPTTPANSCFQPYVVGTTPAASVASTTTSHGVTVPYIVRVERGTLNRGIYDIAVLFDPTKPAWTATAPQPQWNRKVVYTYGSSTGQPRQQFRSAQNWAVATSSGQWDDTALRLGYLVADNSMTDSAYNSNRFLVAETTMMMKEHIVDSYGEVSYVMSNGGSGGAIQQQVTASIHPGVLDGIQTSVTYPDSITTATEVSDCVLLVNAYVKPEWAALMTGLTQAQVDAKKAAINGHRDPLGCHGWNNLFGFANKPGNYVPTYVVAANGAMMAVPPARNNCNLPAGMVYDPVTNPTGTRCGDADAAQAVWGTTTGLPGGASLRALQTNDNVGVQYGLKALLAGAITPEEFVVVNELVGGSDPDANLVAQRASADTAALGTAYQAGIVAWGGNLGKVAHIDSRGFDEGPTAPYNIHFNWRSDEQRARLDAEAGGHGNNVIWRYPTILPLTPAQIAAVTGYSFSTLDTWLSSLVSSAPKDTLNTPRTQAQVVAAKPAAAVDFCYLSTDPGFTTRVTDAAACAADPVLKVYSSPHQVAGGPLTENILKCALKPLAFADYTGVTFTPAQQARLAAVFPGGVCDWSKPGIGQQAANAPYTFAAGPGGVPLPAAPKSSRL